jgi:hypothetical protein
MESFNKIYLKVLKSFVAEFGYEPQVIELRYSNFIADGFWCSIKNTGNVSKTHGLAWRKEQH